MLDVIEGRLSELAERKAALAAELDEMVARGERGELGAEDDSRVTAILAEVREINAEASRLDERRAELAALIEQRAETRRPARVVSEPATYSAAEARGGVSFIADAVAVATGTATPDAAERIARHSRETGVEARAVGTGAFAGLTVPTYLTDLAAPAARAGRPFADICNRHQLPASGMSVEISRITTGTSAGVQATEASTVSETDADDTLLSVPIRTIAGQQTISIQALDRSTGVDELIVTDLTAAYATALDSQIINGSGASGQHLGVRNVTGSISVSYTDTTPTAGELWPRLFDLVQQIQSAVFMGVTHWVMHPRRWWWFASQVGTSFPFLMTGVPQQAGVVDGTQYGAVAGSLAGIPVVVDGNIPTNLGAGTNEDVILGVCASECHLWEQSGPLQMRVDVPSTLAATVSIYGFSAFTAGRYPAATGRIGGTGLVTPAFA